MKSLILAAALLPLAAFAWDDMHPGHTEPPHHKPHHKLPDPAHASANSASTSSATATSASTANANPVQTASVTESMPREAPAVGLGTIIAGCGAGAQGGGSNTHGAIIAGIGWTTDECYAFMLAQGYQAIGKRHEACEVLNTTKAADRARSRGAHLPDCEDPAPTAPAAVTPSSAQPTYTQPQVEQIVRKAASK